MGKLCLLYVSLSLFQTKYCRRVETRECTIYHPPFNISRRDGRLYFPLECVMSFSLLAPARTLYSLTKRWSGLSLLLLYINCTGYV